MTPSATSKAMRGAFSNVFEFFRLYWKRLLLLAVGVTLLLATLVSLTPSQYSKNVAITVKPTLSDLQKRLGQKELKISQEQISRTAVLIIRSSDYASVSVDPAYDSATRKVNVTLLSRDTEALDEAGREVADSVDVKYQRIYEESLGAAVKNQTDSLQSSLKANEDYLSEIERQSKLSFPADSPAAWEAEEARLRSLQELREDALDNRAKIESSKAYVEQVPKDLPRLADEPVSVEVTAESGVRKIDPSASDFLPVGMLGCLIGIAWFLRVGKGSKPQGA